MRRSLMALCTLGLAILVLGGCTQQQSGMGNAGTGPTQPPQATPTPTPPAPTGNAGTVALTEDEARQAALTHAGLESGQVTFIKSKLDQEHGRQIYEIEFYTSNRTEYEYEIDAATGEVIKFECDTEHSGEAPPSPSDAISAEQARELALAMVPGAANSDIRSFKTDYDDGRMEYEGEIIYNGMEYEFTIDAYSGEIRGWRADPVDHEHN